SPGGWRSLNGHPELAQLLRVERCGCAREQVGAAGRLRERDHVADVVEAGHERDHAVESERDPAVGRGAVAEGVEQEAEPLARLVGRYPERVEDALLNLAAVDTDRASPELPTVKHDVVRAAPPGRRISIEVTRRRGERVVKR